MLGRREYYGEGDRDREIGCYLRHCMFEEGTPELLAISNQVHSDYMVSTMMMRQMRKGRWELMRFSNNFTDRDRVLSTWRKVSRSEWCSNGSFRRKARVLCGSVVPIYSE